jgi:hypothetical protein
MGSDRGYQNRLRHSPGNFAYFSGKYQKLANTGEFYSPIQGRRFVFED